MVVCYGYGYKFLLFYKTYTSLQNNQLKSPRPDLYYFGLSSPVVNFYAFVSQAFFNTITMMVMWRIV